jgi:hypothetical protein
VIVVVAVETLLLLVLTVLVFGLLRAYATVLQRLHALEDGGAVRPRPGDRSFALVPTASATADHGSDLQMVPIDDDFPVGHDISGTTLAGETVLLRLVDVEHDTVLVFLSSGCSTCATFWDELRHPVILPPGARLLIVTQDAQTESVASLRKLAPAGVEVVLSSSGWEDYGVPGSPYVIAVSGATGRVRGEGTGQSWTQIAELLARSTGDAGFLTGSPLTGKPDSDHERESAVDRELIQAGMLPGDSRLYGGVR